MKKARDMVAKVSGFLLLLFMASWALSDKDANAYRIRQVPTIEKDVREIRRIMGSMDKHLVELTNVIRVTQAVERNRLIVGFTRIEHSQHNCEFAVKDSGLIYCLVEERSNE